jgi:hypothetical protein
VDPSPFTVISFVSFSCHSKHNQSSSDDGDEKRAFSAHGAMSLLPDFLSFIFLSTGARSIASSHGAILASSFPVARECCPGESPLLHICSNHGGASLLSVAKRF